MPLGFGVIFLVLGDSFEAFLGDVKDLSGCSPKNGCVVLKSLRRRNVCCRLLAPLVGKLIGTSPCTTRPVAGRHRLTQGLHPELSPGRPGPRPCRRGSQPHAGCGPRCAPRWSSCAPCWTPCHLLSGLTSNTLKERRGPSSLKASWRRHHHDIKDDSVANHEVLITRR